MLNNDSIVGNPKIAGGKATCTKKRNVKPRVLENGQSTIELVYLKSTATPT